MPLPSSESLVLTTEARMRWNGPGCCIVGGGARIRGAGTRNASTSAAIAAGTAMAATDAASSAVSEPFREILYLQPGPGR
jgi:hypothetical protein